jgi:hypothetical protein
MASPYSRAQRRRAREGNWHHDFLKAYGPDGRKLGDVTPRCKREIMRAIARGCYVTSTTGGTHSPNSWHYQRVGYKAADGTWKRGGRAVDIGGGPVAMARYYWDCRRRELLRPGAQFIELFGPDRWYVKWGVLFWGQFPDHEDHVHVAPAAIQ